MQSTEGKGQRDRLEALGCKLWHQSGPYHPGDLYKGAEYMLSGKQVAMVFYMVGQCAEAYSQSGAGPIETLREIERIADQFSREHPKMGTVRHLAHLALSGAGPNVCRVSPVEAQEILANPTATKEQIEWAHQQTKTLSGASSPEETGTCLVCPCGKAYRIIGGEIVELSKEQAEVMQEEAASSSQSAAPTNSDASDWCKNDRHEICMYFSCKCKCHSGVDQSAPEPTSQTRTFQQADCPKCHKRITVEVLGLGGGGTGEQMEPSGCPDDCICLTTEDEGYFETQAESIEREKFEASIAFVGFEFTRESDGDYLDRDTQHAWQGWIGRAALAEGSRTRHCAICAENRPATCDGRCELVGSRTEKGE